MKTENKSSKEFAQKNASNILSENYKRKHNSKKMYLNYYYYYDNIMLYNNFFEYDKSTLTIVLQSRYLNIKNNICLKITINAN